MFLRKIGYGAAAAALLIPLYALSQPATTQSRGGLLARYRQDHGLSQANLGEIDPASETMKLATLGLSPVAITMLWNKAQYYQKVEDWTNLSATCEQIVRLEPNFAKVWEHEGWNLSHNVAVNFDDYHDRYRWIIKGIEFMKDGAAHNATNSRLPWYIGWVASWKIGRADEKIQYRRLFRQDDEFHKIDDPHRTPAQRDNWLVGRWWFQKAEHVVDLGYPVMGNSPLIFYSNKPKCLINYAEALEGDDGVFGEVAKIAWENGRAAWADYGARDIPTLQNDTIRLADQERIEQRLAKTKAELEAMLPGMREKIRQERVDRLSPQDRELVDTPRDHRHVDLISAGDRLDGIVNPTYFDVAERSKPEDRIRAMQMAKSITDDQATAREIDLDRSQVNFVYWRDLCEMERDDSTLAARKAIFQAEDALAHNRFVQAGELYDEGFKAWRKSLDTYRSIAEDQVTVGEMMDTVEKYGEYLRQVNQPFPEDFALRDQVLLWQKSNPQSAPRKNIPWLKDEPPKASAAAEAPVGESSADKAARPAEKGAEPAEKAPASEAAPPENMPKPDAGKPDAPQSDAPKSNAPKSEVSPASDPSPAEGAAPAKPPEAPAKPE